jgi:hypothetical protein
VPTWLRNWASTRCASCALPARWTPEGARDWHLDGQLGATVVQPCVVTLAPVTTRLETTVTRRYLADWQEPRAKRPRCREDDTTEALPERIDLAAVMAEALALVLPDYPRAPDAEIGTRAIRRPRCRADDRRRRQTAGRACRLRDRMREDPTSPTTGRGLKPSPGSGAPCRASAAKLPGKRTCMGTESEYVPGLARPW